MVQRFRTSRAWSFVIIGLVYLAGIAVGAAAFHAGSGLAWLPRMFAADVAATFWVWAAGVLLRNSSVYDPYWSVAPLVMLPLAAGPLGSWPAGTWLLTAVLACWGIRLTVNWALSFRSLAEEDWRYRQFRIRQPRFWPLVNLFGINLFPTAVVFMVMVPALLFVRYEGRLSAGCLAGAAVSLLAVVLQGCADAQMRAFRRFPENAGHVNRSGLWHYSRHPNYLGEILMWWGVWLMLVAVRSDLWPSVLGPLVNTLMFVFISVPLMERRQQASKPEYANYRAETGMLLPRVSDLLRRH